MTYDEPMPHLQEEVVDVLAEKQAPAMQPIGRNVDQWAEYFADRSIADLITSLQDITAKRLIFGGVDSRTERDQYDWYHTLRNLIICELVYRLGQDVWHWAGRIETPDQKAVRHG